MQDSINRLMLDGWQDRSVWGYDSGTASLFAQLTRNGNSDDDGPDVWITPPDYPAFREIRHLTQTIAKTTGTDYTVVLEAMGRGQDLAGS